MKEKDIPKWLKFSPLFIIIGGLVIFGLAYLTEAKILENITKWYFIAALVYIAIPRFVVMIVNIRK